jgi:hypothetical protein
VHGADSVGDQRNAWPLSGTGSELRLLGSEENRGGGIGQGGDGGFKEATERGADIPLRRHGRALRHGTAQAPLVGASSPAMEIAVGEAVALQVVEQVAAPVLHLDRAQPSLK